MPEGSQQAGLDFSLEEFISRCDDIMNGDAALCMGWDIYRPEEWTEGERETLVRLHTLYTIACDIREPGCQWALEYFWEVLPADYRLKLAVLERQ